MCVGEMPTELMSKYDINFKQPQYVKYRYLDASKYQRSAINVQKKLLEEFDKIGLDASLKITIQDRMKAIEKMSSFEYYKNLTEGMFYNENGDALTDENKEGKWATCRIGKHFALPLRLFDGHESYQATNKDVDWSLMHLANQEPYKAAWKMVMEDKAPETEEEVTIYKSMKDKVAYFSNFKNEEEYVDYSTAYWNYAYVDENQGWVDLRSAPNEMEWITSFYSRFVVPLQENVKITIFECSIPEEYL